MMRIEDLFMEEVWETIIVEDRGDYVILTNLLKGLKCMVDVYKKDSNFYVVNLRMSYRCYRVLLDDLKNNKYDLRDVNRAGYISKMVRI